MFAGDAAVETSVVLNLTSTWKKPQLFFWLMIVQSFVVSIRAPCGEWKVTAALTICWMPNSFTTEKYSDYYVFWLSSQSFTLCQEIGHTAVCHHGYIFEIAAAPDQHLTCHFITHTNTLNQINSRWHAYNEHTLCLCAHWKIYDEMSCGSWHFTYFAWRHAKSGIWHWNIPMLSA